MNNIDRMARNLSISDSSIGIVHVQERRLNQEPLKEIEKCCLNEKIIYNCPLDDNMVVQGCCPWMDDNEVVHGRCPWTMIKKP